MSDSTRPVTGFHARTDAEKLRKIAALHYRQTIVVHNGSDPGVPFDTCAECGGPDEAWPCETACILAEPGPAVPAHDIDRDALLDLGYEYLDPHGIDGQPTDWSRRIVAEFADSILALVQPVDGVILSPDEVALARSWYTRLPIGVSPDDVALAARLEASS